MSRRVAYSKEEDDALWTYVNVTNTSDPVRGSALWKALVASGLIPNRTWESLKDRYRRYVLPTVRTTLEASPGADARWEGDRLVNLHTLALDVSGEQGHGNEKEASQGEEAEEQVEEEEDGLFALAELADGDEDDAQLTLGAVQRVLRRLPCRSPTLQVVAQQPASHSVRLSDGSHWMDVRPGRDVAVDALQPGSVVEVEVSHARVKGQDCVLLHAARVLAAPGPVRNEAALQQGSAQSAAPVTRTRDAGTRRKKRARETTDAQRDERRPSPPHAEMSGGKDDVDAADAPAPSSSGAQDVHRPPDAAKIARLRELLAEMEEKSGQSQRTVLHALYVASGDPDEAMEYLCTSANETDVVPWSPEEDAAFESTSALAELQRDLRLARRTLDAIGRRRAFLAL